MIFVLLLAATIAPAHIPSPDCRVDGNLLLNRKKDFPRDDENQLASVTATNAWRSEFDYDGLRRRRVRKEFTWSGSWNQTNEVRYMYDGLLPIQERDGGNAVKVTYTRGLDLSGGMQGAGIRRVQ